MGECREGQVPFEGVNKTFCIPEGEKDGLKKYVEAFVVFETGIEFLDIKTPEGLKTLEYLIKDLANVHKKILTKSSELEYYEEDFIFSIETIIVNKMLLVNINTKTSKIIPNIINNPFSKMAELIRKKEKNKKMVINNTKELITYLV